MTTPSIRTPPCAGTNRAGIPVRIRRIAISASTPITESCGPVIPASVTAAVGRPDDPLGGTEIAGELRSSPDVVPERDHAGAGGQQPLRELRRDARAVRGVLSVDDAELDLELGPQARQPVLDRPPTGRAEDIADEQDPHRDPT